MVDVIITILQVKKQSGNLSRVLLLVRATLKVELDFKAHAVFSMLLGLLWFLSSLHWNSQPYSWGKGWMEESECVWMMTGVLPGENVWQRAKILLANWVLISRVNKLQVAPAAWPTSLRHFTLYRLTLALAYLGLTTLSAFEYMSRSEQGSTMDTIFYVILIQFCPST